MLTFKFIFLVCIFCTGVKVCRPVIRMLQVELILDNEVVMDNLRQEYSHSSSGLCSVVCLQEKCECFGFNSVTKICRVHAFCRPDNTIVDELGWKYYRTKWNTFMKSEYLLGSEAATWNKAQLDCMVKGAKLVEVESPEEDSYVNSLACYLTQNVWLGGTDAEQEGRWVWQSNSSLFSYSAWDTAKGQPNNHKNQDCLCLYRPYGLSWCDESCESMYQYICERETFVNI